jgi:hypothetical protein
MGQTEIAAIATNRRVAVASCLCGAGVIFEASERFAADAVESLRQADAQQSFEGFQSPGPFEGMQIRFLMSLIIPLSHGIDYNQKLNDQRANALERSARCVSPHVPANK